MRPFGSSEKFFCSEKIMFARTLFISDLGTQKRILSEIGTRNGPHLHDRRRNRWNLESSEKREDLAILCPFRTVCFHFGV